MNLTTQCERTWQALRRAKPRSKRSTVLQRELVHIQAKRMKREMRGKKK